VVPVGATHPHPSPQTRYNRQTEREKASLPTQDYSNHKQLVPMFHFVLFGLLVLTLIGSFVNLYQSWGDHLRIYIASLIVVLTVGSMMLFFFCRVFALKAQDRAIRAEENLRHYVLTGKLLDSRLGIQQTVALRFACDEEFVDLAKRAAGDQMASDAIKRAVRGWRPDLYRV